MAEGNDTRGLLLQNLEDAGCDEETVSRCVNMAERRDFNGMQRLLAGYRKELLQTVHTKQREIDCLDYLIFTIEKQRRILHEEYKNA